MSINSSPENEQPFSRLGQQEKQVPLLLSSGRSDREIAKALFIGEGTLRNYVHSILSRLSLTDRAAAIAYALRNNLKGHMGYND